MSELVKIRDNKIEWIVNLKNWIATKITSSTTYESLEVRLNRLDEVWKELLEVEADLYVSDTDVELKSDEVEDEFFEIKASITRLMRERRSSLSNQITDSNIAPILNQIFDQQQTFMNGLNTTSRALAQVTEQDSVKLPKISIAKFDGAYKNWPSFEDAFSSSIDNNAALSGVTKLKLLKGLLLESPLSIIKNLLETDANYTEAWTKLKDRYSKRKLILNSYVASFFDLPIAGSGKASDIRKLADQSDEIIIGIRTMGTNAESRDAWLIQILLRKLDQETRQEWAKESVESDFPTFPQFLSFLNKRCDSLEDGVLDHNKRSFRNQDYPKRFHPRSMVAHPSTTQSSLTACLFCHKNGHHLTRCIRFKFCKPSSRREIASRLGVCENCLRADHKLPNCQSSEVCHYCQQQHHTLLHNHFPANISSNSNSNITNVQHSSQQSHNLKPFNKFPTSNITPPNKNHYKDNIDPLPVPNVKIHVAKSNSFKLRSHNTRLPIALLPTALIYVFDRSGNGHFANALLDSGSQCTFVSESLVQRVGLTRSESSLTVSGLGTEKAVRTRGIVKAEISSRFSTNRFEVKAHVLSCITSICPPVTFSIPAADHLKTLDLADPKFDSPKEIDILIGSDLFFDILKPDQLKFHGRTIAQSTVFGWVILASPLQNLSEVTSMTTIINDQDLLSVLGKFWELEEPPSAPQFTPLENECELHFKEHFKKNQDGRYVVRLPFNSLSNQQLGHSKNAAVRRLLHMERRFEKNEDLKTEYTKFMKEYFELNHMELVPPHDVDKPDSTIYYLPHHAVIKPDSNTTKLRVVFDGSCKTTSGSSLNDLLLVGPTIQFDLVTILTRFRIHQIVFSGDIEKMYRQIRVDLPDADFQRIVWRESPSDQISTFRLTTVTYGTSCAPFLAVRTLNEVANEISMQYPNISDVIQKDFYIDDLLSGCDTVSEAIKTINVISTILKQSGFQLRKWKSNSVDVMNSIPSDLKDSSVLEFENETQSVKTLGLKWLPLRDCFTFSINIESSNLASTKRKLLSDISKVFDPLGWVSPVTITMKLLFQRLWTLHLEWDDKLPEQLNETWHKIRRNLHLLEKIELPRHLHLASNVVNVQLHGFSDASISAYAAVVYIRVTDENGSIKTNLVMAKTKVSPIKQVSLPRLELCGAYLLSNLLTYVSSVVHQFNPQIYGWTDSEIVLAWLSDVPKKWKTFIANRTSHILTKVPRSCWNYVPSKQNPADCASRGISPNELISHSLWWTGPRWLCCPSSEWPTINPKTEYAPEERCAVVISATSKISENESIVQMLLEKYSSFYKVKHIVAFILKLGSKRDKGSCFSQYVAVAEKIIARNVQGQIFQDEIHALSRGKSIDRRSTLISLNPFLDDIGVLRVGGRLTLSSLPFNAKHPIILPKVHKLTDLVILESHLKHLHPGPSLQISLLRQQFWILSGRDRIRKFIKRCQVCFRQNTDVIQQLMGNLPAKRTTPSRPFLITGIDYAGPIMLKSRTGRGNYPLIKGYICLFVCFSTRAVHLELVTDMTANAFIAALRRFCGRRGVPLELVSDN